MDNSVSQYSILVAAAYGNKKEVNARNEKGYCMACSKVIAWPLEKYGKTFKTDIM
ncbi:hypothetical protein GCM10022395_21380 [Snuella lapsa]|uniref:Uncharacterized protein n=1 Tax=Snuella lapsa TaxID=870481 RepID=A0ABP6XXQ7_9FLAO